MRLYSFAKVIIRKFNQQNQAKLSPLILILQGSDYQQWSEKKSFGPDGIPGEILKFGGENMIPYLARLLDIMMNNNAFPGDWIKAIDLPFTKGEIDR